MTKRKYRQNHGVSEKPSIEWVRLGPGGGRCGKSCKCAKHPPCSGCVHKKEQELQVIRSRIKPSRRKPKSTTDRAGSEGRADPRICSEGKGQRKSSQLTPGGVHQKGTAGRRKEQSPGRAFTGTVSQTGRATSQTSKKAGRRT